MPIHDYNIANQTFPATRSDINDVLGAIVTNNSNASAPTTTFAYMWWYDTTNNILKQRNGANNAWINIGSYDQTNGLFFPAFTTATSAKTGAYTVVLADRNSVILGDATSAAFTVTLPAAATAGNGFVITIKKTDSTANAVTVDANASETIDGDLTIALNRQNESVTIVCNGSTWRVLGFFNRAVRTLGKRAPDTASASTVQLGSLDGDYVHITGTANISSFGTTGWVAGMQRLVRAAGAFTLVNSANLIIKTGANRTATVGDTFIVVCDDPTTPVHRVIDYETESGASLVGGGAITQEFVSSNQTITSGGLLTLAHGLSSLPKIVFVFLYCNTTEHGWSVGDVILAGQWTNSNSSGPAVYFDSTNVYVRQCSAGNAYLVPTKSGGVISYATNGNWRVIIKAYA